MPVHTIGVIGAGTMGSGIAQAAATKGFDVILIDMSEAAVAKGRRSEKLCPFSATFCRPSAAIVGLNSVIFSDSSSSRERT